MKGLELAKSFYEEYGKQMLHEQFADIERYIAVGLVGSGSECFGFDDDISKDHDFEPGFCMFIPGEDMVDSKTEFKLERAYAKLPKEYMGITRNILPPVGGNRHGVIRFDDFFKSKTGSSTPFTSIKQWFACPDYALAEVTNGEVFRDDYGVFSNIRNSFAKMPTDVKLKKLAGNLLIMAQSGQYNYGRIVSHGESGSAQLAIAEFVKSTISASFLLSDKYMPFYKWSFRGLKQLPEFATLAEPLEILLTSGNDGENVESKQFLIEDSASVIIDALQKRNITDAICGDLEKHAYSVNDKISDPDIRNANILAGII